LYNIKIEDVNFDTVSGAVFDDFTAKGSSSTILYVLNTQISFNNLSLRFNPFYTNSPGESGGVYPPLSGIYAVKIEGTSNSPFCLINNYQSILQYGSFGGQQLGGQEGLFNLSGNGYFEVNKGRIYGESVLNATVLSKDVSVSLINFDCSNLQSLEETYGFFKIQGTLPLSQKEANIDRSVIKNVFYQAGGSFDYVKPIADIATVNSAQFTSLPNYANNAAAIAAGLIPNNIYYNSSTYLATKVI